MRKQELTPQESLPSPSCCTTLRSKPCWAQQTDPRRKSPSAQGSSMATEGSSYPGLICTCGPQMVARDHDTEVIAHRVLSHDPLCLPLETQHELTKI